MTGIQAVEAPLEAVEAVLNYAVDTGEKPVTHTAVLNSTPALRTGKHEAHRATILNGRPMARDLSMDREGFVFVPHDTRVTDFYDEDELRSVYYPEIEALVKQQTGASRVVIFDHTLRAQDEGIRAERKVREPNRSVHNDYTEWSAPKRVRDLLPADEAEALLQGRFAIIQVWRPTRNPVRTNPLAIADARSLRTEELIPSQRSYPGRIGETYQITYSPEHRWFYFPGHDPERGHRLQGVRFREGRTGAVHRPHLLRRPHVPAGCPGAGEHRSTDAGVLRRPGIVTGHDRTPNQGGTPCA